LPLNELKKFNIDTILCPQHHPDCSYSVQQYQDFLYLLQLKIRAITKSEVLQVQGYFNAKVGDDQHYFWSEDIIVNLGANKRWQQLVKFSAINDLVIAYIVFQYSPTLDEPHGYQQMDEL